MLLRTPCPSCRGHRGRGKYLCRSCWEQLTPAARRALRRRDDLAVRRLKELVDQLVEERPLDRIEITP